jgi:hypothetical protein
MYRSPPNLSYDLDDHIFLLEVMLGISTLKVRKGGVRSWARLAR